MARHLKFGVAVIAHPPAFKRLSDGGGVRFTTVHTGATCVTTIGGRGPMATSAVSLDLTPHHAST